MSPQSSTTHLGRALLLPALVLLGGCRGESTGPAGRAARLVLSEAAPDSVIAGSEDAATFRVAAVDGRDRPVEGLRLRLVAVAGGGAVTPATGVTDGDGVVSARYTPGSSPGEVRIRVDAPDALDVAPLTVRIRQAPSARLQLRILAGDDQRAESGTQLPRPFRVSVRRADGRPAAGMPVTWSLEREPGGSRLEPLSLRTDSAGRAGALLTLSPEPGRHEVTVRGGETTTGETVRFRARGVDDLTADFRIDSVSPRPLAPASLATVHGEDLPEDGLELRVEGRTAEIVERTRTRVRIRVPPAEGCRPDRRVGIRAVAGERTSNGLLVPLRGAGTRMDHRPGEIRTYGPEAAECLQLPESDGVRSFRLVVQSVARAGAGVSALALTTRAGAAGADGESGSGSAAGARTRAPSGAELPRERSQLTGAVESGPRPADRIAPLLQERARSLLRRRSVRPAGGPGAGGPGGARDRSSAAARTSARAPREGDLLRLRFAVAEDLTVSCADTSRTVDARVRAVRPSVILAEDTAAGGFSAEDHDLLSREFQELVFPTDTAYFGSPSDLDGNGRVVVLFTPRVNELTPRGAEAAVGGFFLPLDLAESGDGDPGGVPGPGGETCPASNEAEILYLPVPDPRGLHGPEFSRARALRNARGIVSHELMHLLSSSERVILGGGGFLALEEVWLAEALSHLAEEVVGHAFADHSPGADLSFRDFTGSRRGLEAFNTFHLQNFGRLQLHLLDPADTPALSGLDPGGTAGLRMRGYGWLLVRWLADRFASPATEPSFVQRLSTGGPGALTGIENLTSAAGAPWPALLEDFALVPLLEGRDLPEADPTSSSRARRARLDSWELRRTYEGLSENPGSRTLFPLGYPFQPLSLPFRDALRPVELEAGTARYFSITAAGASPALAVGVDGASALDLPSGTPVRITVIRIR